jgi:prepilin peptidase CpaA
MRAGFERRTIMTTTISAIATPVALMLFVFAMFYAAISDLTTYRIANNLVLTLLFGYLTLAPIVGFAYREIFLSLVVAGAVLLAAFSLFAAGLIGGGDAKLASVTTLWLGADRTIAYLLAVALLGGLLAAFFYLCRVVPVPQRIAKTDWVARLRAPGTGLKLPYGVAITLAGLCVLPASRWMV